MQYVLKKDIKKYVETQLDMIGNIETIEQMLYYYLYSYTGSYEVGAIYNNVTEGSVHLTQSYTLVKEGSDTILTVSDHLFKKCFKSVLYERNKKLKKLLDE